MKIKDLILLIKKKINKNILIENISIEDKSFLHKNHTGNDKNKYHLKLVIKSNELRKMKKIESTRKIYSILEEEIKKIFIQFKS